MNIQLVRHATHLISFHGKKLLLDPMFSDKGTLDAVVNAPNEHLRNPLSELPLAVEDLIDVDAVVVTHTHRDHFDEAAVSRLPKHLPLFCQPEDEVLIKEKGFTNVLPVAEEITWEGITLVRTPGEHGKEELAKKMGPVSGFIFQAENEPSLYVIGDSVWYSQIEEVFQRFEPNVAIVFAGEAQFLEGEPITMGLKDIESIVSGFPQTSLIISHMESWNHCVLTRAEVREFIVEHQLGDRVWVLENGESVGL